MIGKRYRLFGTDTIFEITGDQPGYWVITVSSSSGQISDVLLGKQSLQDSIHSGSLREE